VIDDMSENTDPLGNMDHLAVALAPGGRDAGRSKRAGLRPARHFR
jgi:hypothetical protein